jgi:hypothetical protein
MKVVLNTLKWGTFSVIALVVLFFMITVGITLLGVFGIILNHLIHG